jgi:hypothetical protein
MKFADIIIGKQKKSVLDGVCGTGSTLSFGLSGG